jgi:Na+-driven multidrug efflux pump
VVGLVIPCAYVGACYFGLRGLFLGIVVADVASACVALLWAEKVFGALTAESRFALERTPAS